MALRNEKTEPWIQGTTRMHLKIIMLNKRRVGIPELDHKGSGARKNWCFRTVLLEKILESPSDNKEIKPINPKGNQPWIFIGRADPEAEAPILWLPDVKSQFTGKDSNTRKDWGHKRRRWQMMGWLNGITESVDMNLSKPWEIVKDREAWHAALHGVTKNQT